MRGMIESPPLEDKVDSDIEVPQKITSLVNITKIDCGYWHSLALDHNGQAWSAGYNTHAELGREPSTLDATVFGKVNQ